MGWIEKLYETYENNLDFVGKKDDGGSILLPISHSTQNAQVEVIIDESGIFRHAEFVEKKDAVTIIPVTVDSSSRSGKAEFPHPLCDKLEYIAGDYQYYVAVNQEGDDSVKKKTASDINSKHYDKYIAGLMSWSMSAFSHKKVDAIYAYLKKRSLIEDLVRDQKLECDSHGKLTKIKRNGIFQEDYFVRFRVQDRPDTENITIIDDINLDISSTATWEDMSLFESYIKYYSNQLCESEKHKYCYICGRDSICLDKHPSKLRNTGDQTKLISYDEDNFTFRGRISTKEQAGSVGYDASQKVHSALRWLLQKQGFNHNDSSSVVAWESHLKKTPPISTDSDGLFNDFYADNLNQEKPKTQEEFARRLNKAILGYGANLNTQADIVIMSVDGALKDQKGRLAVTYYKELPGAIFLDRISKWHESCTWEFTKRVKKEFITYIGSPAPYRIALAAFGTEQNGKFEANNKLIRTQEERLLHCIIDAQPIPQDIIQSIVNRTSMPQSYKHYNWNEIVSIACALIKKQRNEKYKEGWTMSLNKESTDRSYLYGRLIAVADRVEYLTYERNEKRETNAKRFFSAFVQRPYRTWGILEERLLPYWNKLSGGQRHYYQTIINEIFEKLDEHSFVDDHRLENIYILGYRHQAFALNQNETKEKTNEHIDE